MTKKEGGEEEITSTPEGNKGDSPAENKPEKGEIKTTPKKETSKPEGKKGEDGGKKKEDRTFSQEDVNELMGKVRGQARDAATKAFLEEIGIESADDLKSSLKKLADIERESLSEQERLQTDLNTAQTELEKSKDAQEQSKKRALRATINAEIAKQAANRFQSVDAVLKLIERDGLDVNDEGQVAGVKDALDKVEANYPFMLQKAGVSITSPANPEGAKTPRSKTDDQRRAEFFGMGETNDFWDGQEVRLISEE